MNWSTPEIERVRLENAEREVESARHAVEVAVSLTPWDTMLSGAATVPVPVLWFELSDGLNITAKQAADLLEEIAFERRPTPLYGRARTGYFARLEDDLARSLCMTAWNTGESASWSRTWCCDEWDFLRLTAQDAQALRALVGAPTPSATEQARATASDVPAWPWGCHETELLRHLAEAGRKWWANFDPSDNTTAPTNAEVIVWLKARGVSERVAEVMASILRADGLPTGPRK